MNLFALLAVILVTGDPVAVFAARHLWKNGFR